MMQLKAIEMSGLANQITALEHSGLSSSVNHNNMKQNKLLENIFVFDFGPWEQRIKKKPLP